MNATLSAFFRLPQPAAPRGTWVVPAAASQSLDKGATLVVPQPRGVTIEGRRGSLWLTHDGDCKDVVLSAGDRYVSESPRRLLVHALDEAVARVTR